MKHLTALIFTAAAMGLAAPAGAEDTLPASRPQVSADIEFPAMTRATRPQGVFVPGRHIAMVAPGLKKSEVYTLLDVPHFNEGVARRWNYILNFYTGQGDEFRQCQYQIRYGKGARVEATYWRDAECAALFEKSLVETKVTERIVTERVPTPVETERAEKSFGFTFDFNKSDIDAQGRDVIREIVAEALRGSYRKLIVTGFTDTVGSQPYNDALAAKRAARTVAELTEALANAGSPLARETYSRGGRELAVETPDEVRELQNRRVIVELY